MQAQEALRHLRAIVGAHHRHDEHALAAAVFEANRFLTFASGARETRGSGAPPIIGQLCIGKRGGARATVVEVLGGPYAFEIQLESGEVASLPISEWGTKWLPCCDTAKGGGR